MRQPCNHLRIVILYLSSLINAKGVYDAKIYCIFNRKI